MEHKADLAGLSVLLVEDDFMVSMLAEDILLEAGAKVLLAMQLGAAMKIAADEAVDVAVLDVNLGDGRTSYPVAELLRTRHIPFMFLTGYDDCGLDRQFDSQPKLQKPYPAEALVEAVRALVRRDGQLPAGISSA
jgi:DNA-binding response OmpR family regulator